jgi:hypothetical protein
MWKLPNGSIISSPKQVQIGDVVYPASIFTKWTVEELNAIGIYPFTEKRVDSRYYTSSGFTDDIVDGCIVRTHTKVARITLNELKKQYGETIRDTGMSLLKRVRDNLDYLQEFDSGNTDEITAWNDYKAALKAAYQTIKAEVLAITDFDEMIEYTQSGSSQHMPSAPDEVII